MPASLSRRDFLKLLSLLPLAQLDLPRLAPRQNPGQPNILFLVFDTLSAHHVSLYGYDRETTPNLARFASRARVYHNHYSTGNFTTPGTASIFTGVYPWTHRAINLHGTLADAYTSRNLFHLLPAGTWKVAYTHNLLATSLLTQFSADIDLLKDTRELALSDPMYSDRVFPSDFNVSLWSESLILRGTPRRDPSSLFLSLAYRLGRLNLKRNLERKYGQLFPRGVPNLNDLYFVLEDSIDWIKGQLASLPRPFLAYFHFLPPHEPYTTRREFIDRFRDGYKPVAKPAHPFTDGLPDPALRQQRREYDEYLAYADAEFGRLLDYLEGSGVLNDTVVILTSDHGELFERGIRGHNTRVLYEPLLRVPLLISPPGRQKRQDIQAATSAIDLLPTLLHLTSQPVPDWCEGQILPGLGGSAESARSLYALEAKSNPKMAPLRKGSAVLVREGYKLIHYFGFKNLEREVELYDLSRDPEELEDLSAKSPETATELLHHLKTKLNEVNEPFMG